MATTYSTITCDDERSVHLIDHVTGPFNEMDMAWKHETILIGYVHPQFCHNPYKLTKQKKTIS